MNSETPRRQFESEVRNGLSSIACNVGVGTAGGIGAGQVNIVIATDTIHFCVQEWGAQDNLMANNLLAGHSPDSIAGWFVQLVNATNLTRKYAFEYYRDWGNNALLLGFSAMYTKHQNGKTECDLAMYLYNKRDKRTVHESNLSDCQLLYPIEFPIWSMSVQAIERQMVVALTNLPSVAVIRAVPNVLRGNERWIVQP